ncbi:hypothetical protein SUNI508_12005 [Seiridium unicorne]|uniref:Uncharacterized protein n=1 Tax=Seiridium unicorne TaxID=138068 RepID=A0ABR2UER3_9PEZI
MSCSPVGTVEQHCSLRLAEPVPVGSTAWLAAVGLVGVGSQLEAALAPAFSSNFESGGRETSASTDLSLSTAWSRPRDREGKTRQKSWDPATPRVRKQLSSELRQQQNTHQAVSPSSARGAPQGWVGPEEFADKASQRQWGERGAPIHGCNNG